MYFMSVLGFFHQGLARLERWERAAKYGLNPPASIRQLILQHKDEVSYTQW